MNHSGISVPGLRLLRSSVMSLLLVACAAKPVQAPLVPDGSTAGTSSAAGSQAAAGSSTTGPQFCRDAQAQVSMTGIASINVVHGDYESFVSSKPRVRPLETEQFVWYEDAAKSRPKMVSCKMKTSDHIRTEYGSEASAGDTSCAALNARTVAAVLGSLTRAERRRLLFGRGTDVVHDDDILAADGSIWLAPFTIARVDASGALHLQAKTIWKDWLDPRFADRPVPFRGVRYCHLVAPEYLRRLVLGEISP